MPRPVVFPDFALLDVVDPVSNQNNVAEPSDGKKAIGWDRFETPPRQYMNWIHRITAEWAHWLDEITQDHEARVDDLETIVGTATSLATPDSLALRDSGGRFSVADPNTALGAVNRDYLFDRVLEPNTNAVFYQLNAPNGWILNAAVNDRALMAVNNTSVNGGTIGGSWTLAGLSVEPHGITEAEMPPHRHTGGLRVTPAQNDAYGSTPTGPSQASPTQYYSGINKQAYTSTVGGGFAHTHGLSGTGTWRPSYAAVLICRKLTLT